MSKQNPTGAFLGGLIIGSALGTVVGLLIAPRTGKETRKVIKKSADALPELAEDLTTSLQLQADRLSESTLENWEGTLARLKLAIATGIETSRATTRAAQANKLETRDQDFNSTMTDHL
jgi:gas vesicle protein